MDRLNSPRTPLVAAIETNQYDLTRLLLCNGYDPELEPRSILNLVLERKAWDYLELLLEWGADPTRADPDAVFGTYQRVILDRFWNLGNDFTRDRSLAWYLASTASNKPLFGWAKHHQRDPRVARALALALSEVVVDDQEKSVALLMWAGADSHLKVQSLRWGSDIENDPDDDYESAVERAVGMGHGRLLRYLKPEPELDDFGELYSSVCDPDAVDALFDRQPPDDWSKAIVRNASRMGYWYGMSSASRACLERIFEHHWGRLSTLDLEDCQPFRRDLLKISSDWDLEWLLKKLAKPHHCAEEIYTEIVRTPSIRTRMGRLGLSRLLPIPNSKKRAKQTSRPKPQRKRGRIQTGQPTDQLGHLDPETKAAVLRNLISREQLYEEVWSEPATKVAERYGVSSVAVAKWCNKLDVPRPGRGYWARKNAGQKVKQLPLPRARKGQHQYVSRPDPNRRAPDQSTAIPGLELFKKPIPVPEDLDPEHPHVAATRLAMGDAGTDKYGIIRPQGRECLEVSVSETSVDRALMIMNALILALEGAEFAVEIDATSDGSVRSRGSSTFAVINGERVPFSLTEKTHQEERAPTDEERAEMRRDPWKRGPYYAYSSTGELTLQIKGSWYGGRHRRKWSDGETRRLEECLYPFVRSLLISAEVLRRHRPEAEGWRILT